MRTTLRRTTLIVAAALLTAKAVAITGRPRSARATRTC